MAAGIEFLDGTSSVFRMECMPNPLFEMPEESNSRQKSTIYEIYIRILRLLADQLPESRRSDTWLVRNGNGDDSGGGSAPLPSGSVDVREDKGGKD
jgi:hypothetical protein